MRGLREYGFALAVLAGFGSGPAVAQFDEGVPVELVRWFSERNEVYAGLPPNFPDFALPGGLSALAFQDRGPLQHVVLGSELEGAAARDAVAEALIERGWRRIEGAPDDEFRPALLCEDAQGTVEVRAGRAVVSLRRYLANGFSCEERFPPPRDPAADLEARRVLVEGGPFEADPSLAPDPAATLEERLALVEEARLVEEELSPAPPEGAGGASPDEPEEQRGPEVVNELVDRRPRADAAARPASPPVPVATRGYLSSDLTPYEGNLPLEAAVLLAEGGEFDDGFPDNFPRLNLPAGVTLRGSLDQTTRQQLAFATRPPGEAAQTALAVDLLSRGWKVLPPAMTDGLAPGLTLCHPAFGTLYLEGGYEPDVLYLRRSIIDRHQPFCAF